MADVTVTVDSSGNANNPTVAKGQTIQWQLAAGVTGTFSLDPPNNMFHNDDNPGCVTLSSTSTTSPTYTVKQGAAGGNHTYTINSGACPGKPKLPTTGPQTITVDPGLGHPHHKK
jgi:hypothetical protein